MDRTGSGLRRLTGLLLALNLGVLALGTAVALWPESNQGGTSFNAEKVRLLGVAEPETKPASPALAPGSVSPAVGLAPLPAEPTAAKVPVPADKAGVKEVKTEAAKAADGATDKSAGSACLTWKAFDQRHYDKMLILLAKRGVKEGGFDIRLDKPLGWWVYTAPYPDQDAAQAALKDVQARKVKSALIIKSGELKNALSLGAFPDRRRAQEHVKAVTAKGIKGVLYGPRRIEPSAILLLKEPQEAKVWRELARDLEAVAKPEPQCAGKT
jgi:hypothetical protein